MAIIILPLFFSTLLLAFAGTGRYGLRQSLVYAATVYTLCLVLATELFSIWNVLVFEVLLTFWTGLTILLVLYLWFYGNRAAILQTLNGGLDTIPGVKGALGSGSHMGHHFGNRASLSTQHLGRHGISHATGFVVDTARQHWLVSDSGTQTATSTALVRMEHSTFPNPLRRRPLRHYRAMVCAGRLWHCG